MSVRVRFAPSPTGHLHVGNVRTALYNWLFARQKGGSFVLRIEDTDLARSERQFEEQLMEDLRWLGLTWDEGIDVGGPFGPYRQTDRFTTYQEHAERLLQQNLAFYCFCSVDELEQMRERQLADGEQLQYSGKCRSMALNEAHRRLDRGEEAVLRLKVRDGTVGFDDLVFGRIEIECAMIGDFVLLRSDGSPQYNFACVVDDSLMQISHVIRGEGHLSNTHRQVLLYEALGLSTPVFAHLSTILGADGTKLSKRHGATSIDEFRRQGYLPEALDNYLALLGWAPSQDGQEILDLAELVREFDLDRVNRSPAVFDSEKLNWVNRSHLRRASRDRLAELALPYLQSSGLLAASPSPEEASWATDLTELLLNHVNRLDDLGTEARRALAFDPDVDLHSPDVLEILAHPGARSVIQALAECLDDSVPVDGTVYREIASLVKQKTGQKGKHLFHPIRVAVTGRASGPDLERLIPLLERGQRLPLPAPVLGVKGRVSAVLERLR